MNLVKAIAANGVLLAILGHGFIGVSLLWDKVLLGRRATPNLVSYIFWLGAISIFGLALLPFGFRMPNASVAAMAFGAGVLELIADYFYYAALKAGEASEELAVMGGFTPVATALISVPLLKQPLGGHPLGFILLTLGGFIMFFADKTPKKKMLPLVLSASTAFAMTDVLQKIAFNNSNFVTVYVFFTMGTFTASLAMLVPPSWREQIFERSKTAPPKRKLWYMVNRFLAGVASFLLVYAISRTSPALVEAISGVRYAVIFTGALAISLIRPDLLKETFSGWMLAAKVTATGLVIAGLAVIGLGSGHGGASAN
jgi:drug/metabolite transporter (DMT)-like permease